MSDVERIADNDLIKRILPHRYPFLLVDKVVDIDGFNKATGLKKYLVQNTVKLGSKKFNKEKNN